MNNLTAADRNRWRQMVNAARTENNNRFRELYYGPGGNNHFRGRRRLGITGMGNAHRIALEEARAATNGSRFIRPSHWNIRGNVAYVRNNAGNYKKVERIGLKWRRVNNGITYNKSESGNFHPRGHAAPLYTGPNYLSSMSRGGSGHVILSRLSPRNQAIYATASTASRGNVNSTTLRHEAQRRARAIRLARHLLKKVSAGFRNLIPLTELNKHFNRFNRMPTNQLPKTQAEARRVLQII